MLKTEILDPFKHCVHCGQPLVGVLPDGWSGWCPVCREAWLRWWSRQPANRKRPIRKLKYRRTPLRRNEALTPQRRGSP